MNKTALFIEFIIIFITPPLLVVAGVLPKTFIMPLLWAITLYAYLHLHDAGICAFRFNFTRTALWHVLKRFFLFTVLMTLFILLYKPESFLALPSSKPWFWLAVMLLYPILSAFVQEVLFRSFFFYRYEALFQGHMLQLITANAMLFAYIHIVFENWIAVLFTFIGGILFAHTYLKTRSTMLVAIEHALYGDILYTLGFGYYFYHGANI